MVEINTGRAYDCAPGETPQGHKIISGAGIVEVQDVDIEPRGQNAVAQWVALGDGIAPMADDGSVLRCHRTVAIAEPVANFQLWRASGVKCGAAERHSLRHTQDGDRTAEPAAQFRK